MGNAKHTPGPWRHGKVGGCVVADAPVPEVSGSDAIDYYGGHLIAESIAPQNVPAIAALPELLAAAIAQEEAEDYNANECPDCSEDDSTELPELCEHCFPYFDKARVLRRAAIAKAKGE